MNLHDNQSLFAAAVQFASRSKEDGGLGIKPIFIESDQARFNEPLGWQSKSFSESPLLTSFDGIWDQLKNTYIRELPDLAYQIIPSEQEIKQSFIELSSQLF